MWNVDATKEGAGRSVDIASRGVSLLKVTGRVMQKVEQRRVAATFPAPTP